MSLLPLKALRTFEVAARLGSFASAAEELHVTPSAVSHQIKALESHLGVVLFHRRTRHIELTEAAASYLPVLQEAFRDIEIATRRLSRRQHDKLINLDVAPAFASGWLITRLHDFYRQHPGRQVRLSTSSDLVDFALSDHDMAIRYGAGDWPGLVSHFLVAEELVPLCAPALLGGRGVPEQPTGLLDYPLLLSLAKKGDWERWFDIAGVDYGDSVHGHWYEDTPLALEAAVAGGGFAIANRLLVTNELSDGRLIMPFSLRVLSGQGFYLVYPEARADDEKLTCFRDWILSKVASA